MAAELSAAALEAVFIRCRDMDAPLEVRLSAFADEVRNASTEFAEAVDRLVARLVRSKVGNSAPEAGEPMPEFVMPDESGRLVSLEKILENGPVAVVFQRGHWCPYCRINTDALSRAQDEIKPLGGQIVAISPDLQRYSRALKTEACAPFSMLTDLDNGYALSLNLVFRVDDGMSAMIRAAGWDIANYQGNESWMLPVPATFVVDTDGIIRVRHIDPDYRRRMSIQELIDAFAGLAGNSARAASA